MREHWFIATTAFVDQPPSNAESDRDVWVDQADDAYNHAKPFTDIDDRIATISWNNVLNSLELILIVVWPHTIALVLGQTEGKLNNLVNVA